ncbi:hypothetical protein, partial [Salmonella enterica]|uniref:hypothetical protein n=1 Tax=Salmonella enterica TaxID=28901 RepID=UPI0020C25CA0
QRMAAKAQRHLNNRRLRKLIARNGKHSPSSRRLTQPAGVMASEDLFLASMPDGIQDSFEVRSLARFLSPSVSSNSSEM